MSLLLTVSRAARLVGVTRGAIQKQIKDGALPTFEGMVRPDDLLHVYPQAQLEHTREIERIDRIKDSAFGRRVRERMLPDAETLAARLGELGSRLAQARADADFMRGLLAQVQEKLLAAQDARAIAGWLAGQIMQGPVPAALLAQDSVMRVMVAHVRLLPSRHEFFVEGNDTLLEAALGAGLSPNYGCSDGSCGRCKARVVRGQVKRTRVPAAVLSAQEQAAGVVQMCAYTAVTDLELEAAEANTPNDMDVQRVSTRVKSIDFPLPDLALLHLRTPIHQRARFLAGQCFTLNGTHGVQAQLAVAGCPCDDGNLYFHVHRDNDDAFARAVFARWREGQEVELMGPHGDFVLVPESERSIVFIAFELGFAPIKALIEHAMALDSAERLHLCWVARRDGDHYMHNLCRSWADALDTFRYQPLTLPLHHRLGERAALDYASNILAQIQADSASALPEMDIYIAAPPWLLGALRMRLEQCGVAADQVRSCAIQDVAVVGR